MDIVAVHLGHGAGRDGRVPGFSAYARIIAGHELVIHLIRVVVTSVVIAWSVIAEVVVGAVVARVVVRHTHIRVDAWVGY